MFQTWGKCQDSLFHMWCSPALRLYLACIELISLIFSSFVSEVHVAGGKGFRGGKSGEQIGQLVKRRNT